MERTVFNKAQLEMLDIMANIRSDEELDALKHAVTAFRTSNEAGSIGHQLSGADVVGTQSVSFGMAGVS